MKKNSIRGVALAGLIGASLLGGAAEAAPVTVNFSFLNSSAATVANGSLTYSGAGTITSFSGFSAFNINFFNPANAPGATTQSFVLSQLIGLPSNEQFVDFNTTTNQFAFTPDPDFFNIPMALVGDNGGAIDFFIQNQAGSTLITDNSLNLFNAPISSAIYQVLVPEPASVALFGAGMLALSLVVRRRKKI